MREESQCERDELLDNVRTTGYDLKFYRRMVQMLMKEEDIARIKSKSSYDDNQDEWIIPPFMLKAKEVTLPQLKKNGYDVMEQEKENRELAIEGGDESEDEDDDGTHQRKTSLFAQNKNGGVRTSLQGQNGFASG